MRSVPLRGGWLIAEVCASLERHNCLHRASRRCGLATKGRVIQMPGTIIRKALEPLATSKGEILVLLSLQ